MFNLLGAVLFFPVVVRLSAWFGLFVLLIFDNRGHGLLLGFDDLGLGLGSATRVGRFRQIESHLEGMAYCPLVRGVGWRAALPAMGVSMGMATGR